MTDDQLASRNGMDQSTKDHHINAQKVSQIATLKRISLAIALFSLLAKSQEDSISFSVQLLSGCAHGLTIFPDL